MAWRPACATVAEDPRSASAGHLRFDLLCFDLDGTLVDTASEIAEAVNRGLESCGQARQPVDQIIHLVGAGLHSLVERLHARLIGAQPSLAPVLTTAGLLAAIDRHYIDVSGTLGQPYPGAHAALDQLLAAGVQLACVTNKETRHARRVLAATGLAPYFSVLIGGDTLPCRKPDAAVLRHVMAHFEVPVARTAHVGDSWIDVAAARNAGVQAWAVSYGYNAGQPIQQSDPDQVFGSLPDVAAFALARS